MSDATKDGETEDPVLMEMGPSVVGRSIVLWRKQRPEAALVTSLEDGFICYTILTGDDEGTSDRSCFDPNNKSDVFATTAGACKRSAEMNERMT